MERGSGTQGTDPDFLLLNLDLSSLLTVTYNTPVTLLLTLLSYHRLHDRRFSLTDKPFTETPVVVLSFFLLFFYLLATGCQKILLRYGPSGAGRDGRKPVSPFTVIRGTTLPILVQ